MAYQQFYDKNRSTWQVLLNTGLILFVGTPVVLGFVAFSQYGGIACDISDSHTGKCDPGLRETLAFIAFGGLVLGLLCSAILGGVLISKQKSPLLGVLLSWGLVVTGVIVHQGVSAILSDQVTSDRMNRDKSEFEQQVQRIKYEADSNPRFPVIDSMVTRFHDDVMAELKAGGGRWDWGLFKDSWTEPCSTRNQDLAKNTVELTWTVGAVTHHDQHGVGGHLTPERMQQVRDAFRSAAVKNGFTYEDDGEDFNVSRQDVTIKASSNNREVSIDMTSECHYR